MTDYTPLDSLKETAAQGHLTLAHAVKILSTPDALGLPGAVEAVTKELVDLHEMLLDAVTAHVEDINSDSANNFSDGRPVRTLVPLEEGVVHNQVWAADPASPRNQAGMVSEFRTNSATHWRVFVLRPGEVDAVRVED